MRPRFFAGQLLTEDDLSALMDYVVAKNRFHNSRLFGEGVVCGLLVECGPCDGQIVVDPGYALDCCGNDLVLTCEQTLDIAPMIRELAANKHDCGCSDPCEEAVIEKTTGGKQDEGDTTKKPGDKPCKQYDLYARYAERPDQPVAAYPVGDNCDAASCEPTRVVEGIVFELRCVSEHHVPNINDVRACCDDKEDGRHMLHAAESFAYLHTFLESTLDNSKVIRPAQLKLLREAHDYDLLVGGLHADERPHAVVRVAATLVPLLARIERHGIELTGIHPEQLKKTVVQALGEAAKSADDLDPIEGALFQMMAPTDKPEHRALGHRAFDFEQSLEPVMRTARDELDFVAKKLETTIGCDTKKIRTHCGLSTTLGELKPPIRVSPEPHYVKLMSDASFQMSQVIRHYYSDCDCAAVNPPCPPCDDPGVLLARIDVDHCKVVTICNAVREYVYAPSTLRYWDAIQLPWGCTCGTQRWRETRAQTKRDFDRRVQLMRGLEQMTEEAPSLRTLAAPARASRYIMQPVEDVMEPPVEATVERKPKEKKTDKKGGSQ